MFKKDRGTVIFAKLYSKTLKDPAVINVYEGGISGFILNGDDLQSAFKRNTLLGSKKHFSEQQVFSITSDGVALDLPVAPFNTADVLKLEFLVVYPDGTAKTGEVSNPLEVKAVIWDQNIARDINNFDPTSYYHDDWKNNPAITIIGRNCEMKGVCDAATTTPCNHQ